MIYIASLVLLIPCAVFDIKKRKIPIFFTLSIGITALGHHIFAKDLSGWEILSAVIIAALFFLFSRISKESLGYGDSFLLLAVGLIGGGIFLLGTATIGFFLAGMRGLISLIRKNRKKEIPFAPYLLAAALLWFIGSFL